MAPRESKDGRRSRTEPSSPARRPGGHFANRMGPFARKYFLFPPTVNICRIKAENWQHLLHMTVGPVIKGDLVTTALLLAQGALGHFNSVNSHCCVQDLCEKRIWNVTISNACTSPCKLSTDEHDVHGQPILFCVLNVCRKVFQLQLDLHHRQAGLLLLQLFQRSAYDEHSMVVALCDPLDHYQQKVWNVSVKTVK